VTVSATLKGLPSCSPLDARPRFERRHPADQLLGAAHRLAVDAGDQISGPHARRERLALDQDIDHGHPAVVAQPELRRPLRSDVLRHETEPPPDDVAVGENLLGDTAHQVHRDGETDTLGTARGAVEHGGVDADEIAARIDQGAAGIAEIDGCIRLDEVLESS
jgi:hypothetical protein